MNIAFRPATVADHAFVVDNWLSSFRTANAAGIIATENWFRAMWPEIVRLLEREGTTTILAYDREHIDFYYGFICGDVSDPEHVVHYCYVKEPFRRVGYARALFAQLGVDVAKPFAYTCMTGIVARLRHKIPLGRWSPQIARYPKRLQQHQETPWPTNSRPARPSRP